MAIVVVEQTNLSSKERTERLELPVWAAMLDTRKFELVQRDHGGMLVSQERMCYGSQVGFENGELLSAEQTGIERSEK